VSRSDKGQKYLLVQFGMVRPADERPYPTLFSLRAVPFPQAGEGFPFISTAIKCWVDTYSRLTGPVMTPLGGPSIYAA